MFYGLYNFALEREAAKKKKISCEKKTLDKIRELISSDILKFKNSNTKQFCIEIEKMHIEVDMICGSGGIKK